jgi:type VI secretion system protein ImpC
MPLINDTSAPFGERTLAAIMFTDVVNFSALAGEKEDRTLAAVRRDFQLMFDLIARANGTVLKTLGDGLLAHFTSAVNAVACAQEIQLAIAAANRAGAGGLPLQHRIGIHLGDVFITENDIVGNGVNIAARLQKRAEPGGICISQTVFDVVKGKLALHVTYLGPQELTHIRESIPIYLVLPRPATATAAAPGRVPAPAPRAAIDAGPAPAAAGKPPTATFEIGLSTRGLAPSGAPGAPRRRAAHEPLSLLVLADLSGRGSPGVQETLAGRRALPVDVDTLESVFARLAPRLRLPALGRADEATELAFANVEAFHPDELLRHAAALRPLAELRRELTRPATAAAAAEKLRARLAPAAPGETDAATLSRLLGEHPAPTAAATAPALAATPLERIVQSLVRASAPAGAPDVTAALAALDLELTTQLRAVLQHPDFQALEAAWRGLQSLVRDFGDGETVKLHVLDVTRAELAAAPAALASMLRDVRCHALVLDLQFGGERADIELLGALAQVAAANGAQLLAGAQPALVGCESFARTPDPEQWDIALAPEAHAAWLALRRAPVAQRIFLAAPRVLLRAPYGKWSDAIATFAFEELPASLPHEAFLWGNAAFACAHVLAAQAARGEPADAHSAAGRLGGLPLFRYTEDGEKVIKPCAEAWLTDRAVAALASRGVTALQAIKGVDAARIGRLTTAQLPAASG